jgi:hypothetical protein
MNKRRIQSLLDRLPLHEKQALAGWLTTGGTQGTGITYREARQRLFSAFGVKTSTAALSDFYHRCHRAGPVPAAVVLTPDQNSFTLIINVRIQPPPA